jgi:hypothetical protein
VLYIVHDRNSTFGVATCYRLALPGIQSPRGQIFRTYAEKP